MISDPKKLQQDADQADDRLKLIQACPSIVMASNMDENIHRPNEKDVARSLDLIWPSHVEIKDLGWRRDGALMRMSIESGGFERHLRIAQNQVLLLAQDENTYRDRSGESEHTEGRHFALVTPRVAVSAFVSVGSYCDENFDGEFSAEIVVSDDPMQMQAHVRHELSKIPGGLFDAEELLRKIYGDHDFTLGLKKPTKTPKP